MLVLLYLFRIRQYATINEDSFSIYTGFSNLVIKNSSSTITNPINFKQGIRIEKYGELTASATTIALAIESTNTAIIKGDIYNYGLIEASGTTVKIGTTTAGTVFPLVSDTEANSSFFWNYGLIEDGTAFDIQAPIWFEACIQPNEYGFFLLA